jgi:hypothetical protein
MHCPVSTGGRAAHDIAAVRGERLTLRSARGYVLAERPAGLLGWTPEAREQTRVQRRMLARGWPAMLRAAWAARREVMAAAAR